MLNLQRTIKALLITSALSLILLGSSHTLAKGDNHHKKNQRIERLITKLELSAEQVDDFKAIMQAKTEFKSNQRNQKKEIRDLIKTGNTDLAAETAASYARQNTYTIAEQKQRLSEVLTQAQLTTLNELKSRAGKRKHKKHHRQKSNNDDSSQ